MQKIYKYIIKLFSFRKFQMSQDKEAKNFFDLSAKEQVKIMRAAGREAQKEQQLLLQKYAALYRNN